MLLQTDSWMEHALCIASLPTNSNFPSTPTTPWHFETLRIVHGCVGQACLGLHPFRFAGWLGHHRFRCRCFRHEALYHLNRHLDFHDDELTMLAYASFWAASWLRNKYKGWIGQHTVLNKDVAPAWNNTAAVYNGCYMAAVRQWWNEGSREETFFRLFNFSRFFSNESAWIRPW